ncbi:MAG: DUF1800 family protein, partial [Acidobacteriaceae bacterium]|nr:DUF1800 family protein [Acidobacteriaceae bacterium]
MKLQQYLAVLLCLTITAPATVAVPTAQSNKQRAPQFHVKLSKDKQIEHALDRLTFGPRPGDFEQLKKMGLKKWIDLQLHPERIPE